VSLTGVKFKIVGKVCDCCSLGKQVLSAAIYAKSVLVTSVVSHGQRYATFIKLICVRLLSASGQCIIRASSRGTVCSVQLLLTPWLCTSHGRYF
jgi:hypothetical protein